MENPVRKEALVQKNPEDVALAAIEERTDRYAPLLGGFPTPDESTALEDAQHDVTNPQWMQYWRDKVLAEVGAGLRVPAQIKDIVRRRALDGQETEIFHRYVQGRSHSTRFWMSQQAAARRLHEELGRIDAHEDVVDPEAEHVRTVSWDASKQELYATSSDGVRGKVTLGDVAADRAWGLTYRPDDSVPAELWRRIRRVSAIRGAQLETEDLYNRLVAEREGLNLPTSSWSLEQIAKEPKQGIVAERMIQTLLVRLQYDNPEFGVEVEASNAFEDDQLKYDFKVIFKTKHRRGVAVCDPPDKTREIYVEEKRRLGLQFTVDTSRETLAHKAQQLVRARGELRVKHGAEYVPNPPDDVVLVAVPMRNCSDAFLDWEDAGRPPGGPERFMSMADRLRPIQEVFRGRLAVSDAELRESLKRPKLEAPVAAQAA